MIGFIIGLIVGMIFGVMTMCILIVAKDDDDGKWKSLFRKNKWIDRWSNT